MITAPPQKVEDYFMADHVTAVVTLHPFKYKTHYSKSQVDHSPNHKHNIPIINNTQVKNKGPTVWVMHGRKQAYEKKNESEQ